MAANAFQLADLVTAIDFAGIKSALGSLFVGMAGVSALVYAAHKILSNAR